MKLKCFFLTIVALLFLFNGCNKDAFFGEESDLNLKSAELKMVPIKGDILGVITSFDAETMKPDGGYLAGKLSHFGELNPEESTWVATKIVIDPPNPTIPSKTVDYDMEGFFTGANGDKVFYTLTGILRPRLNDFNAEMWFNGGTGRFENATGKGVVTGILIWNENHIPESVAMQLDGMISSVGSSK